MLEGVLGKIYPRLQLCRRGSVVEDVGNKLAGLRGGSDGVRAKMTGDWREGWDRAISFAFWSAALL